MSLRSVSGSKCGPPTGDGDPRRREGGRGTIKVRPPTSEPVSLEWVLKGFGLTAPTQTLPVSGSPARTVLRGAHLWTCPVEDTLGPQCVSDRKQGSDRTL